MGKQHLTQDLLWNKLYHKSKSVKQTKISPAASLVWDRLFLLLYYSRMRGKMSGILNCLFTEVVCLRSLLRIVIYYTNHHQGREVRGTSSVVPLHQCQSGSYMRLINKNPTLLHCSHWRGICCTEQCYCSSKFNPLRMSALTEEEYKLFLKQSSSDILPVK